MPAAMACGPLGLEPQKPGKGSPAIASRSRYKAGRQARRASCSSTSPTCSNVVRDLTGNDIDQKGGLAAIDEGELRVLMRLTEIGG